MMWLKLLPYAGWPLAVVMGGMWLGARDDVIEEREGCNASKLSEALESQKAVADAERKAHEQEVAELVAIAEREREAARIASEALAASEDRPAKVRTIVKEVPRETEPQICLDIRVDPDVRDSVRGHGSSTST